MNLHSDEPTARRAKTVAKSAKFAKHANSGFKLKIFKMAAKSMNEVLEDVLFSPMEVVEPESGQDKCKKIGLQELIQFTIERIVKDGDADKEFFVSTAVEVLLPLYKLSQAKYTQESQLWASTMLTRDPIYPSSILRYEATIWLQAISRRLGGKGSIRHPYYSEIHRDMPYDIFKVILKLTKSMQGFCEPFCYQGSNKKADVISFISLRLVNELLCLLSGVSEINLATYFKRTLGGRRKGHKTSVIVSE